MEVRAHFSGSNTGFFWGLEWQDRARERGSSQIARAMRLLRDLGEAVAEGVDDQFETI